MNGAGGARQQRRAPSGRFNAGGAYEVAFQATPGTCGPSGRTATPVLSIRRTGLQVRAGTSPAITGLADGDYEVAFQNNNRSL